MKKVQAEGRALWASHLVNGDPADLSEGEFAELQAWLAFHGVHDEECVGAEDTGGYGRPDAPYGYQLHPSNLATYTFLVERASWRARQA